MSENGYTPLSGFQPRQIARCWLVLHKGQVVTDRGLEHDYLWSSLDKLDGVLPESAVVTGAYQGKPVGVVELASLPPELNSISIRSLLSVSDATVYAHLSHSLQIMISRREHAFCGCCGQPQQARVGEWAMVCPGCGHRVYPRISPCIIVLVTRGDEMLLVRHRRHGLQSTIHTLVAGFVEPGESAEEAVLREVYEETGLTLGKIRYCFSQSWPFPHSLMMGFHGEYSSGELVLEEEELCGGGWFRRDNLPELPPGFSIARKLIDIFI